MDGLRRVPGLAWLIPTALGGALRFHCAASLSGVWEPHLNRGEGYYEGAVNFLGYHVLAERVPSFLPVGTRGPLYQAFIVFVEFFFSAPHPGHVVFAQAAMSTLAIVAAYELASELSSPWAGLLAALWMALDFGQIEAVGLLDLAAFYQLAILALASALVGWAKAPSPKRTLLLALTLASSLICRSSHFAAPLLLVAACLALPRWKASRRALPLLAGAAALLLGVTIAANFFRFGRLVPMDVETGSVRFYATTVGEPCCAPDQIERYRAASTDDGLDTTYSDANSAILRRGLSNIRERPFLFAKTFLRNGVEFWRPYAPALGLGLLAAFSHGLEPGFQAVLLTLFSFLGYHALVVSDWHSGVVLPLLAVLAGVGLGSANRAFGPRFLSGSFFRRPQDAGYGRKALISVFAGLYVVVLVIFATERLGYRTARIANALGNPSAAAHRAPLALLDLSVERSRGRYGLEERAETLSTMGLYARACADLARLARLSPSSVKLARRAERCAAESALGLTGLLRIKSMALSESGMRELNTDLRLPTPCDWPGWSKPESGGLDYLDLCILASPRNPYSRQNRGVHLYLTGNKKGAAEDFRAAVKADASFTQAHISLSTVLFELGRGKEALPPINRAVNLAASGRNSALHAAALESRASVLFALGDRPGAEADRRRALKIQSGPQLKETGKD